MNNIENLIQDDQQLFLKNLMLTTEFNKYIIEHPDILNRIPENALVILLPSDDPEFCSKMMKLVEHYRAIDDVKNRPVIYIRIQKLAPPPPSRITKLSFESEHVAIS
ncbi:MAG: hypothetical protein ONB13_10905 [candidate division KSB1 bacterium]|nr:hypothetical protein [candidate division KSB1 bacterium]MDZ7401453.1 hypothetical protein [candidate division KSB1 bacterium]